MPTQRPRPWGAGALLLSAALALAAPAQADPVKGGVATIATIGEPPTLDPMASTADLVGIISQHIFETLYTFGDGYKIVPLLAADQPAVGDGGKTYTIKLRQGVKFHDGSTMTSADVKASLERWEKVASRGQQASAEIAGITAPDPATVVIQLKEPYAPLMALLSLNNSAAVVLPAGNQAAPMTKFIGTGPYAFKERVPDQYIRLTRFADYAARDDAPNGYGGKRTAYLDELRFVPVPDANTRIQGVLVNQFDFADTLPVESMDRLKGKPEVEPLLLKPFGYPVMVMNTKQGVLANPLMRQAVQAALGESDMLEAAFGFKEFYDVDGAFYPPGLVFHSDVGVKDHYNLNDPEKAKALAAKAGYKGEPIRLLTSTQYEFHYKMALVAVEQMQAAGLNVDMQVNDWATLVQRRNEPGLWEIYITHSPFLPEPTLTIAGSDSAPGWWSTEAKHKVLAAFNAESDPAKREKLWDDVQQLLFTEVPAIKIGDFNALSARSSRLKGFQPAAWPHFWNAWIEK